MKTLMALITLTFTLSGFASEQSAWKNEMFCGHYKQTRSGGVTFDDSKYGVSLGAAVDRDGVQRNLELFKYYADGSSRIKEGFGCTKRGNYLTCQIGDVSVDLDVTQTPKTHVYEKSKFFTYKAKITTPVLLVGLKTFDGTCKTAIRIK